MSNNLDIQLSDSSKPIRVLLVQKELNPKSGMSSFRGVVPAIKALAPKIELVGHAHTGKQGIEMALSLRPDIVLSDSNFEDMGVLLLAAKLFDVAPQLPVIAMSASNSTDFMRRAMFNGVDDFLSLPVDESELLHQIKSAHSRGKADVQEMWDQHLGGRRPIQIHIICNLNHMDSRAEGIYEKFEWLGIKTLQMWSYTGKDGIERVKYLEPEIVVIDDNLPDIDPYELIDRFQIEMPTLPIVFMAKKTKPEYLKMAIRNPIYGYLEKPFSKLKLLKILLTVTKKHETGSTSNIQFSDTTKPIRVLLVQEELDKKFGFNREVVSAIKLLAPQIELIGHAHTGKEGIEQALSLLPDIVLSDISLEDMSVLILASKLSNLLPQLPIIIMSVSHEIHFMQSALRNGVNGFLGLPINKKELLHSLTTVHKYGKIDVKSRK